MTRLSILWLLFVAVLYVNLCVEYDGVLQGLGGLFLMANAVIVPAYNVIRQDQEES